MPEAEDPAPWSEQRNNSRVPFFRRRCPSVWCQFSLGQRHKTQPLIYHTQDLAVVLMSQDIQQRSETKATLSQEEDALALLN